MRSYIGGGFRGLNGSQSSEILIATSLTYLPSAKFSGRWAEVSSLVLTLRPGVLERRVFHSAPRDQIHDQLTMRDVLRTGIKLERSPV